jgi:hypothetical protein
VGHLRGAGCEGVAGAGEDQPAVALVLHGGGVGLVMYRVEQGLDPGPGRLGVADMRLAA